MIITFKKELIELIIAGKKTQTRRKLSFSKNGKAIIRFKPGWYYTIKNSRFKPDEYGVIRVKSVGYDCLGNISEEDAIKEGFGSRQEFIDTWIKIHGVFDDKLTVAVLDFEYEPQGNGLDSSLRWNDGGKKEGIG